MVLPLPAAAVRLAWCAKEGDASFVLFGLPLSRSHVQNLEARPDGS